MSCEDNLQTVPVTLQRAPYEVRIGQGILSQLGKFAKEFLRPCRCVLITDETVAPLHANPVLTSLKSSGFTPDLITIPSGEASKSMTVASELCDRMIELGLDRKSAVFALGGGVVGDLAAFVAAIYFRGIPVVQIPTTVVAQVDSSIGGKTGVNSPLGKNLIGSFHQPSLVVADTETLRTLPDSVFREGLAEVIKHGVIADAAMLKLLPPFREDNLTDLIARNVAIKAAIVSADEFELSGTRALLNFGHTIGHAIESTAGYGSLSHGECVAIGMIAALDLSVQIAGLPQSEAAQVRSVIEACGLPVTIPAHLSTETLLATMTRDKKFNQGAIRFVLTDKLGSAFVSDKVTLADVTVSIEKIKS